MRMPVDMEEVLYRKLDESVTACAGACLTALLPRTRAPDGATPALPSWPLLVPKAARVTYGENDGALSVVETNPTYVALLEDLVALFPRIVALKKGIDTHYDIKLDYLLGDNAGEDDQLAGDEEGDDQARVDDQPDAAQQDAEQKDQEEENNNNEPYDDDEHTETDDVEPGSRRASRRRAMRPDLSRLSACCLTRPRACCRSSS